MASPSAASSGSSALQTSASEEDLQQAAVMDLKKRKRMISNRDSARRSRMRKQKHLNDLMAQVEQLREDNGRVLTALNATTQHYLAVESENSVLRTQMTELGSRLHSLNEILHYMNAGSTAAAAATVSSGFLCDVPQMSDAFTNPWNLMYANQPIMASADSMFQY